MAASLSSRLAVTAGLVLLAGCSSLREAPDARRDALLTSLEPSHRRSCRVVDTPEVLPTTDQLLDSAAFAVDVVRTWQSYEHGPGYALFTLSYDPDGLNIRREIIEHNLRPTLADSLQQLVFTHRKELPAQEAPWGVRFRVEVDPKIGFQVGRQEFCEPLARNTDLAMEMGLVQNRGIRVLPGGAKESTVWVRVLVNPAGRVTEAELGRGAMADHVTQTRIFDHMRTLTFDPATEDGHPVSAWVSVPVRIVRR